MEISDFGKMPGSRFYKFLQNILGFEQENTDFKISRFLHLATLINIEHIWEARSQKVGMEEPDLRIVRGNI